MIERIKAIIAEQLNISKDKILPDSKIVEDLGADSLDIVELLMIFEEEYDITITDEQARKLTTIAQIEKAIQNLKK